MNTEQARRFAQKLLETNASEVEFDLELVGEAEIVAQELRLLGCRVKTNLFRPERITVIAPPQTTSTQNPG